MGGRGLSGHLCGVGWREGGSLKLQPSRAVKGLPCLKLYGGHFMKSKLVGVEVRSVATAGSTVSSISN